MFIHKTKPHELIARKILNESIDTKGVWYHGRSSKNTNFDLSYTGIGNDEDGVGFYFTRDEQMARSYAAPNGNILSVELKVKKLVGGRPNIIEIMKLIQAAPNLKEKLEDWGETTKEALNEIKEMYIQNIRAGEDKKEIFESIWADFYDLAGEPYLKQVMKLGYDGHISTRAYKSIIIYNPKVIKILEVTPYK